MNQEINEHEGNMLNAVSIKKHALDITTLVLVAVLFAAGCILDFTVAKALSIGNIKPETTVVIKVAISGKILNFLAASLGKTRT